MKHPVATLCIFLCCFVSDIATSHPPIKSAPSCSSSFDCGVGMYTASRRMSRTSFISSEYRLYNVLVWSKMWKATATNNRLGYLRSHERVLQVTSRRHTPQPCRHMDPPQRFAEHTSPCQQGGELQNRGGKTVFLLFVAVHPLLQHYRSSAGAILLPVTPHGRRTERHVLC